MGIQIKTSILIFKSATVQAVEIECECCIPLVKIILYLPPNNYPCKRIIAAQL